MPVVSGQVLDSRLFCEDQHHRSEIRRQKWRRGFSSLIFQSYCHRLSIRRSSFLSKAKSAKRRNPPQSAQLAAIATSTVPDARRARYMSPSRPCSQTSSRHPIHTLALAENRFFPPRSPTLRESALAASVFPQQSFPSAHPSLR